MRHQPYQSSQVGISMLRVRLGVMWIAYALLRLLVFTLPGTAQFFQSHSPQRSTGSER
jgi:putative oxidoreductase